MLVTRVLERRHVVSGPAAAGQRVLLDDAVGEPGREVVEVHIDGLGGEIGLAFAGNHRGVGGGDLDGGKGGEGRRNSGGAEEGVEEGVDDHNEDDRD